MTLTVGHIGVVVSSLSRMRRFYGDVLGLRELRRIVRRGPHIDGLTGLTDVELEIVILGTEEHPNAVEFLKYHRHPSAIIPRGPSGHGMNHIHFIVDDLTPILAMLEGENLECWGPPQEWPDNWSQVLYAKDPEENVIEFTERLP